MTARFALAASLLALGACQPPATEPAKPAAAAEQAAAPAAGCNVSVEKPWIDQETPVRRYTVSASVVGPSCQQGVALLIIRQREGTPIYTWSGEVEFLFGLKDAADPVAMKKALLEWVDQGAGDTTASLPPWEETEGQPKRSEFPFMPAEGIDKTGWEQLKKDNLDMFCFPQGGESLKCAVLRPGADGEPTSMEEIGLQLFPG